MKTHLIQIALTATAAALLTSCDENSFNFTGKSAPSTSAGSTTETTPDTLEEETIPELTTDEVSAAVLPRIADRPYLSLVGTQIQCTPKANGDLQVKAAVTLKITEDLYLRVERPTEFHEARKVVAQLHQTVERPDSSYLLDLGADTALITDEERKVKQLPPALASIHTELVNLSESYCYKPERAKDSEFVLELSMDASWKNGKWELTNIVETEDLLSPLAFLVQANALPENPPVLTPEFVTARLSEIAAKADAFKTEAESYHKSREEELRGILNERQAQQKEHEIKAAEIAKKEAEAAEAHKEWSDFCIYHFGSGCKFKGEWKRNNRFGELTIQIDNATFLENSIIFYGIMYDTKLPQAFTRISGRTALTREEDGTSKVNVTLYDGQYDPDEPTAEVYDAADGRLILTFDKKGNLSGIMTCASWVELPEKNFDLHFSPGAKEVK